MSLEKEELPEIKAKKFLDKIQCVRIGQEKYFGYVVIQYALEELFRVSKTEKLREDYEDCICCGGSGEIDEGEEPYEVKINDCPCCKGKGIIHKELQQTKEKLKRCEEVVDGFKKNILLLEKLRQSGNNYLDVATNSIIDKLITQLKDNG